MGDPRATGYELATAVLNTLPEPIFVKDTKHRWVMMNDAFCAFLGQSREDLLGRSDYDLFSKDEADVFWAGDERVLGEGKAVENEEVLTDGSGTRNVIRTRKAPFVMPDGGQHLLGIIRNITKQRRMEAQLVQSERLASVGTLAAGVAHEINNPLTYVSCNITHALSLLDRLGRSVPADVVNEIRESLTDAAEGTVRVAGIVGDLRALARPHSTADDAGGKPLPLEPVDVEAAITASMRMANLVTRHRARVEVDLARGLPMVSAIEPRLCQVLVNVIANAAQAFVGHGPLRNAILITGKEVGDDVEIVVSDNGPGIDPARLGRIFEPFVTGGNGMGLGLSISDGIVRSFGGKLEVTSELGVGTRVHIRLKGTAVASAPAPQPSLGATSAPTKMLPRVLVVDDEPLIRALVTRCLRNAYDVTVAADVDAAIRAISEASPPFDAILSDVRMPEVTGVDFWKVLSERWPDLAPRFLFMTGGMEGGQLVDAVEATGRPCLKKPFAPEALMEALEVLVHRSEKQSTPGESR